MPELSAIRLLVTGDDEADLGVVTSDLEGDVEVAHGLSAAVASMRLREFGVLVADVESVQDALVLLRAARRSRPATRGLILVPADRQMRHDGWELVEQAAFAVLRHPVRPEALQTAVDAARRDYAAERTGFAPIADVAEPESEEIRWMLAERRLAGVLKRALSHWTTRGQGGVDDALRRSVAALTAATREAEGSPDLLMAIAEALNESGAPAKSETEAA